MRNRLRVLQGILVGLVMGRVCIFQIIRKLVRGGGLFKVRLSDGHVSLLATPSESTTRGFFASPAVVSSELRSFGFGDGDQIVLRGYQ